MSDQEQAPPAGLEDAGQKLWSDVVMTEDGAMVLRPDEAHVLEQACRCADRIAALAELLADVELVTVGSRGQAIMHPAIVEERMQRDLLAKLLGRLAIPEDDEGEWDGLSASQRARRAARFRWDKRTSR